MRVRIKQATPEGEIVAGSFCLKDGKVVAEGKPSPIIGVLMETGWENQEGTTAKPADGIEFLKNLLDIRCEYIWAETF